VVAEPWPESGTVDPVNESTDQLLHPLLSGRWSPTTFDQVRDVTAAEVDSLLEAARWAPSAGNSQPWAFIVGRRGESEHDRLVRHLAKSSAAWAPSAGLLVANLSHRLVQDTDWDYSEFCLYDLGQAVAHMSFQAQSLGMHVRQFRAFDRAGLAAEFNVPHHWEIATLSAIGHVPLNPDPDARVGSSRPVRRRRPSTELRWPEASVNEGR
jgi:nitroreductase